MARPDRAGRAASLSAVGTLLGTLLVPKCPLCIAALMTALGFGAASANVVAPILRPLLLGLALIAAALALVAYGGRRLSARRGDGLSRTLTRCCASHDERDGGVRR